MAATWTEQYRAISNRETAGEDGLSVRAIRDLADGLNNWARWGGGREKVISEICLPAWASKDTSNTDENVIAVFAPRISKVFSPRSSKPSHGSFRIKILSPWTGACILSVY